MHGDCRSVIPQSLPRKIRSVILHFAYGNDESVASPCHGFDELMPVLALTQSLPEQGNILRKISFLDKAIGPYSFHHRVFGNDLAAVFHKREQHVEDFGSERDDFAVALQEPLGDVNPEAANS